MDRHLKKEMKEGIEENVYIYVAPNVITSSVLPQPLIIVKLTREDFCFN